MTDGFSKDGADALALSIMTFWREHGHNTVKAWTYRLSAATPDWGVRSNLVSGLPRR